MNAPQLVGERATARPSSFQGWDWAFIYDLYEEDLFPIRKEPEDFRLPVGPGLTGVK